MTTTDAGVIIAVGYWDTQAGDPGTAPGAGKYRADNWATPALVGIAGTDKDGYDRYAGLLGLQAGDSIIQLASNNSENYQTWSVTTVTDMGGWVLLGVVVTATGSTFAAPGSNQTRLLQALQMTATPPDDTGLTWQLWAPPLDPPTAGGLPLAVAENIAAAYWLTDPHLCAALQWEAWAATLPPTPSVANVSTGVQSVGYSPPMPGGEYGLAMARAAWHRSLRGNMAAAELTLAPPSILAVYPHRPTSWWVVA